MNKREARAKQIVEAIVAGLNKKHGYELFIRYDTDYIQLESGRFLDSLSIRYPNHALDNIGGSFCLVAIDDKPTYVRLLNKMLNNLMVYHTSAGHDSKRIPIDIKKVYGKTMDEIEIALDLAA
jgi:hypothetical protein